MVYHRRRFAARKIQRKFRQRRPMARNPVSRLRREVAMIKRRSPPAEVKMCNSDVTFSNTGQLTPTVTQPVLLALNTPDTLGTAVDSRIGAKVTFTHISAKLRIKKENFGDKRSTATLIGYLIWLKNADYSTEFEADFKNELLNKDQNAQYSPMCYWNKQRYSSWLATNKFKITLEDKIPLSQGSMGLQSATGNSGNTSLQPAATLNNLAKTPETMFKYVNWNKSIRIDGEWQNKYANSPDETKMTRMKPYLFVYTDCEGQANPSGNSLPNGVLNDSVGVQGTIRLSYTDA